MANSITVETRIILNIQGRKIVLPFVARSTSLTEIRQEHLAIEADATQVVWNPTVTGDSISDFKFLALVSDGDLDVEFTANEGDANEEIGTVRLTDGLPYMLGADDSYYNHSASDAFAGTLDVIDKIRIDEPASAARVLTFIIGTYCPKP